MSNVVPIGCITKLDLPVDRVIDEAKTAGLKDVVIIGFDADGQDYFASSVADGGTVLWLMERSKKRLLE